MTADRRLREALRGVRGLVLDADGVIVLKGAPMPGSMEAVAALTERGIPFRVVTNFSSLHRETLAGFFAKGGLAIDPDRIITGTSAAAAYTRIRHAGQPLFVLAAPDALREFDGQRVVGADEADAAAPGTVAAVVLGDAGDEFTFRNMDVAFRLVRGGSDLLTMHRNPWWLAPKGETLDAGAYVVGLEFATGKRARILGKPSAVVFRQAVAGLQADLGARLPRSAFAMVGDDLRADVAAAQRVGMKGILVLSGKTDAAEAERAAGKGSEARGPDGIGATLADVVAALD